MKKLMILLCAFFAVSVSANAQTTIPLDSIQKFVKAFSSYVDTYDKNAPENEERIANYNKAIDLMTNEKATQTEKNEAFKYIDAYIKADKNTVENGEREQHSLEDYVKQTDDYKKAENAINQAYSQFTNMSYPEFETTVRQFQPTASTKEIKEAYNKIHGNDGKAVAISGNDNEMTEEQRMIWALDKLKVSENYEEFRETLLIIRPDLKEDEIKKAWDKFQTKQKK